MSCNYKSDVLLRGTANRMQTRAMMAEHHALLLTCSAAALLHAQLLQMPSNCAALLPLAAMRDANWP
jgi:hypothetical protein